MGKKIELTNEFLGQLLKEYESMTSFQLGEKYGVSHTAILNYIRIAKEKMSNGELDVEFTDPKRCKKSFSYELNDEFLSQLLKEYENMTSYQLGEKYGVSNTTILNYIRIAKKKLSNSELDVEFTEPNRCGSPSPYELTNDFLSCLLKKYESMTSYQLGEKYGVSNTTILKYIHIAKEKLSNSELDVDFTEPNRCGRPSPYELTNDFLSCLLKEYETSSIRKLSKKYNVSIHTIQRYLDIAKEKNKSGEINIDFTDPNRKASTTTLYELNDEFLSQLLKEYESMTSYQLGEKYGVSSSAILNYIRIAKEKLSNSELDVDFTDPKRCKKSFSYELNDEFLSQLLKEYESMSSYQLGEKYGISNTTILKYIHIAKEKLSNSELDVDFTDPRRKFSSPYELNDEFLSQLLKEYESMTLDQLGEKYGVSKSTILKYICIAKEKLQNGELDVDFTEPKRGRLSSPYKLTNDFLSCLLKEYENMTSFQLSEKYGVSKSTILKYICIAKEKLSNGELDVDFTEPKRRGIK